MSAFRLIRSVVVKETLHLTLARNVLYSTGGTVQFYDPCFVPRFGVIDEPICTAPTEADGVPRSNWYNSTGQVYEAVEAGFRHVQNAIVEGKLFGNNRAANHLHSVASYWNQEGGGVPIGITNLATVEQAVNQIVSQGEGASRVGLSPITFGAPDRYVRNYKFSHYEKFTQILEKIKNIKADADADVAAKSAGKAGVQQATASEQAWADKLWPLATNPASRTTQAISNSSPCSATRSTALRCCSSTPTTRSRFPKRSSTACRHSPRTSTTTPV